MVEGRVVTGRRRRQDDGHSERVCSGGRLQCNLKVHCVVTLFLLSLSDKQSVGCVGCAIQ